LGPRTGWWLDVDHQGLRLRYSGTEFMIGEIVHDYALGMNGVVVSGAWTEERQDHRRVDIGWEWLVLYEDGELQGANTNDLKEIENEV
tara:strand:- start:74 stop:337 length:264 start_codon:yes stop_codon:yes gene_type:complete